MCTTAVKKLANGWFLLKTRDPVSWMRWDDEIKLFNGKQDKFRKLIIQNPEANQDGYYGGINEQGVAIVATFVKVAEDQISYIRKPYIRLILNAATAAEAVAIIEKFNPRIGGNIFVADREHCFGIEAVPSEYFIEEVEQMAVKTNHFHHIGQLDEDYRKSGFWKRWTETHYKRAHELLKQANSLADFEALLKDRQNADKKMAICTTAVEEECFTHSAFIFDCHQAKAYYAQGNPATTPFKEYGF